MRVAERTADELLRENEELRRRLEEAEDTIRAISGGEVDAFVVACGPREEVLTLGAADRPYRLLVEAMRQGAATLGADGTVLYANRRFAELIAAPPGKIVGASLGAFLSEADRPRFEALLLEGRAGGAQAELELRRRDGGSLPVSITANSLPGGAGGVCLVVTDLTDVHRREQERLQLLVEQTARAELERQVEERTAELKEAQRNALQRERLAAIGQMAAGLAHESRNALQRSQACLSVLALRLKALPQELDILSRMQRAQEDLHRLYEEVREYAAPIQLQRRPAALGKLWREAWDDLAQLRAGRDVPLREDVSGVDCDCVIDPFRIKQVFRNLLENALAAAGDPPCVEIHCSEADMEGCEAVRIAVRDNGPGFAPEQRGHLFEPFHTTKVRGTGLGLAICRRIVEAHGGRIEVGEAPGRGAEIIITLPRRKP